MLSLPMNEFFQQSLAEVGIEIEFEVVESRRAVCAWRSGTGRGSAQAAHGNEPRLRRPRIPPHPLHPVHRKALDRAQGSQLGRTQNRQIDKQIDQIRTSFENTKGQTTCADVHENIVDDALILLVVPDPHPTRNGPQGQGVQQAQRWFQDFNRYNVGVGPAPTRNIMQRAGGGEAHSAWCVRGNPAPG